MIGRNRIAPTRPLGFALVAALLAAAPVPNVDAHAAERDSYVLMSGGEKGSSVMHGSTSDLREARMLRTGSDPLLYVRRNGKSFVVRDAATLRRAEDIFAPQTELGRRQAALGSKQAALGSRQAQLGARQAAAAARQVASSGRSAAEANEQKQLGEEQEALGRQQAKLGQQQERLGREQDRLGREAEVKFRALVDEAIRSGLARETG